MEFRREVMLAALAAVGCGAGTAMLELASPNKAEAQSENNCGGDCATNCNCGCILIASIPQCCTIAYLG